ncbi:5901_t:CDS:1, partial [Paraglomus brasilianum]
MSDPTTSIVYTEIARLNFTTEERTALRSFFSNHKETKNEAEEVLPTCATDVEK